MRREWANLLRVSNLSMTIFVVHDELYCLYLIVSRYHHNVGIQSQMNTLRAG